MKHIKRSISVGLTGFIVVLASRGAMAGSIGWFELFSAIVAGIIFVLANAFFDIHLMFNDEDEEQKENDK